MDRYLQTASIMAEGGPLIEMEEMEDPATKTSAVSIKFKIGNKWEDKGIFCQKCKRIFKNKRSLAQHQKKCLAITDKESFLKYDETRNRCDNTGKTTLPQSQTRSVESEGTKIVNYPQTSPCTSYAKIVKTSTSKVSDSVPLNVETPLVYTQTTSVPSVPNQSQQPTTLTDVCPIDDAYEEIVKWRRNLFNLPKGNNGKKFVEEMTSLINNWCMKNDEKSLKLLMIMPSLLLQRTSKKGKARDNKENLRRRLELWEGRKLSELVDEGKVIQDRLTKGKSPRPKGDDQMKQFRNHMIRGNVNPALRLLDEGSNNGLLQINNDIIKQLHEKHPEGQAANHEMLLKGPIKQVHHVIFDEINSELVQKVALRTKGAAGP